MMMRSAGRAASIVAVTLALTIAAPAAATVDAKTVPVKAWSTAVCKDFSRWRHRLATQGSTGALTDPAAAKQTIVTFLTGVTKATSALTHDLQSAGVPSVTHGKAIATVFVNSAKTLRSTFRRAKTDAAALPTGGQAAFATAAHALAAQLRSAGTTLSTALITAAARYPTSALATAFASTKACTTA